jgi:hypothetical protein
MAAGEQLQLSAGWPDHTLTGEELGYTLTGEELGAAAATFSNGQLNGVEAVAMNVATRAFSFVGGSFGAPYVFYIDSEGTDLGAANLSFTAAVPEPQTYALMLGGLGLIGWMARRRKA